MDSSYVVHVHVLNSFFVYGIRYVFRRSTGETAWQNEIVFNGSESVMSIVSICRGQQQVLPLCCLIRRIYIIFLFNFYLLNSWTVVDGDGSGDGDSAWWWW